MAQFIVGKEKRTSLNFIDFCKAKSDDITEFTARLAASVPKRMYKNDHKMDIDNFTTYHLCNHFEEFKRESDTGYDFLYISDKPRISFKFNKTDTFQRESKRFRDGRLTTPRDIMIRNFYNAHKGREICEQDLGFDYLFSFSYDFLYPNIFYGPSVRIIFGVASSFTVLNNLVENSIEGAILRVRLCNHEWDYCSGYQVIPVNMDKDRSDYIYQRGQEMLWDTLLTELKCDKPR